MIVRFRLGNITETRPVHGKLDHHVSAGRKRDGFKQLHVSVEFTKYGNTLFRPVLPPMVNRLTLRQGKHHLHVLDSPPPSPQSLLSTSLSVPYVRVGVDTFPIFSLR